MLRLLITIILLQATALLFSQQSYNIKVNSYNLEDGLSHNQIRWLHKDSRGMMWIGTANGINRYDGKSFKLAAELNFFKVGNRKILEDHEGDLWLRTNYPKDILVFFNTRTERVKSFEEKFGDQCPFSETSYSDAIMLGDSTMIVKTKDQKLISYDTHKKFRSFNVDLDSIRGMISIPNAPDFWLESPAPQDKTKSVFNFFKHQLDNTYKKQVSLAIKNTERNIWTTKDQGLLFWNKEDHQQSYTVLDTKGRQSTFPFPHRVSDAYFPSIAYDEKQDNFLMLLDGQVSVMPRGDTTGIFTSNVYNDLIAKQVNFEFYKDNIFWIGGFYGLTEVGIKSSPFKRTDYHDPEFFTRPEFRSVRFVDNHFEHLKSNWPVHLRRHYTDSWTSYKDENGRHWFGNFFGISYLDPGAKKVEILKTDTTAFKEATGRVYQFYKDQDGQHWVLSDNGIYQLDIEKKSLTERYASDDSLHYLPSKDMRHMYQDQEGIFWIGTFNGLMRWDKKNNQHRLFTTKDGLSNNHIMAVYEDDFGFLWMSSDNGLMQFEKSTERVKVYLPEDGITHREFNRAAHLKDSLGNLYFGSLNGVTHFHPKDFVDFKDEQHNIPLLLMDCVLFSEEKEALEDKMATFLKNKKIVMRPGDRYLKLQFALLDYSNPNSVQYVFDIDGETWNAGKESTLNISGLPYGKHTLTVRGRAGNGLFSKQELSIPIEVLKPFYLQWWFILLSGFFLLFAAIVIQEIRTRVLIQRQQELELTVVERTQTIQSQAEELRQLDKSKSRFLANISHEFRTPLTLILNTLDQKAIDKITKADQADRKLNFSEIEVDIMGRNARRLSQLIEQLLDLSTLEAGKMKLKESAGDFQFYIKELVRSFELLAKNKNIEISFNANLANPNLNFDRDKLDKIIYNLLSNAVKFTPANGRIKVSLIQNQKDTIIEVQDSGVGITKVDQVRIFDRFYQVNQTDDYTHEGTGLGLALVKELVDIHQGSIQLESKIGEGTYFKIALPLSIAPILENANDPEIEVSNFDQAIDQPSHIKIGEDTILSEKEDHPILLVIEDNEDLLYHHQKMFASQYQLITATDGIIGLEKAFEHIPDLIICDVMMPGKNGYEVCEQLKSDERTNHIPIVLLTAKVGQEEKINGLSVGANEYLTKPYSQNELALRLNNLLAQQRSYQKEFLTNQEIETPAIEIITPEQVFVKKCTEVIEENLNNYNFGVEDFSAALGMSRVNLFRKLKAITGITPSVFIRTHRLEKAKSLLLQSAGNASEISYMVGFNEPSYFYKCFKTEYGMTVGQFLESQMTEKE